MSRAIPGTQKVGLLPLSALSAAAACLKTMAHPMRLRMVEILMQGSFTVREIAGLCEIREHQACGHLRLMQGCGLLTSERRGQAVYYRIVSPQLPALLDCVRRNCGGSRTAKETAVQRST